MIRQRRLDNEWELLVDLARLNAGVDAPCRTSGITEEVFRFHLRETTGLRWLDGKPHLLAAHEVIIRFPRYFPGVPMEASLVEAAFHPNVDPENGFVCLWNRYWAGDSIVEALSRLQQIIAWRLHNPESEHVMQPDALRWLEADHPGFTLPLPYHPIELPPGFEDIPSRRPRLRPSAPRRRRLSSEDRSAFAVEG